MSFLDGISRKAAALDRWVDDYVRLRPWRSFTFFALLSSALVIAALGRNTPVNVRPGRRPASTGPDYFCNRPFFDKFPSSDKELYTFYSFTPSGIAVYGKLQNYRQENELFFYRRFLDRVAYWFPHSSLKGITACTLEECTGPGTFDLKLTLTADPKAGRQSRIFYSWKNMKHSQALFREMPLCRAWACAAALPAGSCSRTSSSP